jgi:hypothetical protein
MKFWSCECGYRNTETYSRCRDCNKLRPDLDLQVELISEGIIRAFEKMKLRPEDNPTIVETLPGTTKEDAEFAAEAFQQLNQRCIILSPSFHVMPKAERAALIKELLSKAK